MDMEEKKYSLQNVQKSGFFKSKGEKTQYLILKCLQSAQEPVGAWVLKSMLEEQGCPVSIATIGRVLKELDSNDLTHLVENQGRALTEAGEKYVETMSLKLQREHLNNRVKKAVQIDTFDDLLELLNIRRILECEATKQAALKADESKLEVIRQSLGRHRDSVEKKSDPTRAAFDFHKAMAIASTNPFLLAVLDLLIFEEVKIESNIGNLITRERGAEYVKQHEEIYEAVAQRNASLAESLMNVHMITLQRAIEDQLAHENDFEKNK